MANETRTTQAALDLLSRIYPEARQIVEQALGTSALKVFNFYPSKKNPGILCLIDNEDYLIGYLAFAKDVDSKAVVEEVQTVIESHRPADAAKEFYFNIYGRNQAAVRQVQALGFKADLVGYKLRYNSPQPPRLPVSALVEKGFVEAEMDQFSRLFDDAYYDINVANSWPTNWHTRYAEAFKIRLQQIEAAGGFASFWQDADLAAVYLIQDIYISDLVVHPKYQSQGYGRYLLIHALNRMLGELRLPEARLNVARTNTRAQRFYERMGFVEIGCFADHVYVPPA